MFDLRDLTIDDLQPERQQDRPAELLHGAEEAHLPRTGIGGVHLKPRRPLRRTHPQAVAQLNRGGVLGVLVHRGQRQSGGIVFDHGGQVPIHDGDEACAVALRRGSPRGKLQEHENEGQSSRSYQGLHSGIHPWSITLAVRAEGPGPRRLSPAVSGSRSLSSSIFPTFTAPNSKSCWSWADTRRGAAEGTRDPSPTPSPRSWKTPASAPAPS